MSKERDVFEKRFDTVEKEVLVLTEEGVCASRWGKNKLWKASVTVLAVVDVGTGAYQEEKCCLEWQMTEKEHEKNKLFDLQGETVYRLRVRESLPFQSSFETKERKRGESLWVREVLDRNCSEKRLDQLLEKFRKPVVLHLESGEELRLDKPLGIFSGEGSWNGEKCLIHLDADAPDTVTADDAQAIFYQLLKESKEWDDKARKYAAEELTDTANHWLEEGEEEITKEDFAKRLDISEVCVSADGTFEIFYHDDDMFGGHAVIVSGTIEDGIEYAEMAG